MIAASTLALAVSGGVGAGLATIFFALLVAAWMCEGTRWQLSARLGLIVLLASLPLFFLDWKLRLFSESIARPELSGLFSLVHFILFLALLKIWQVKADRDWLFLYLISFFKILLAAGLSISPFFLLLLGLYILCASSTVVCFEIRKARRNSAPETRTQISLEPTRLRLLRHHLSSHGTGGGGEVRRLPLVAAVFVLLIFSLALPIFFIAPRFQGGALTRAEGGVTGLVGFSDEVTIGEIAKLERSNQLVMRVRVDDAQLARQRDLRWRGVALDQFDGRVWRRSDPRSEFQTPKEGGLFPFGTTTALDRLTTQSFFIEPVDTPVLFAAPRAVAIQAALPFVGRDREGGLVSREHSQERIAYRAYSDTTEPPVEQLRSDVSPYPRSMVRYLEVPENLDPRVAALTRQLIVSNRAGNRYDAARVVEEHLKREFQYSLDLKAGGGDPLADFLFRVRAGNCEYFSTSLAVMLRTADVATRVVNGFQTGEYNAAADAFTVRQADAHSWVEVYFPETDAWVTFDATPPDTRTNGDGAGGLSGHLQQYAEALELFWIQYVVSYDKQEQRSLANSLREQLGTYQLTAAQTFVELRDGVTATWRQIWKGEGEGKNLAALLDGRRLLGLVVLLLLAGALGFWALRGPLKSWRTRTEQTAAQRKFETAISFYQRMTRVLANRGLLRAADQTPLEFALSTGIPEVLSVTNAYHRVRYGDEDLSPAEAARLEEWLRKLEEQEQ